MAVLINTKHFNINKHNFIIVDAAQCHKISIIIIMIIIQHYPDCPIRLVMHQFNNKDFKINK